MVGGRINMAYVCNRALPHSHTTEPKEPVHYITVCKRNAYSAMTESEQLAARGAWERVTANGQVRENHGSRSDWQK